MKRLAAAIGCLAISAALCAASAIAAPVGLIEEFDVDGSAIALAPGSDGNVWFTYDRDFNSPRGSAIGRIGSLGKETLFGAGFRKGSELGDIVPGPDGNLWFTDTHDP